MNSKKSKQKHEKEKRIRPIPSFIPHNIPLNLYDPRLLTTPGHVPPAVNTYPAIPNIQALNHLLLNPLMYYWPYGQLGPSQGIRNVECEQKLHNAAIKIQKRFRGYRVRKECKPELSNTPVKRCYSEDLIDEVVKEEIMNILTELSERVYLPFRNTAELKARRIFDQVWKGLVFEACVESIHHRQNPCMELQEKGPVSIYQSVYEELLRDFIKGALYVACIDIGMCS
jgi:hypothetical protein